MTISTSNLTVFHLIKFSIHFHILLKSHFLGSCWAVKNLKEMHILFINLAISQNLALSSNKSAWQCQLKKRGPPPTVLYSPPHVLYLQCPIITICGFFLVYWFSKKTTVASFKTHFKKVISLHIFKSFPILFFLFAIIFLT